MSTLEKGYGAISQKDEDQLFETAISSDSEIPNDDDQQQQPISLFRQMVAECIGTCILVQVGGASLCAATYMGVFDGLWQVAILWGLGLTIAIAATASLSGAHLNPAVTLSFGLIRCDSFSIVKVIPYWIAQLVGAAIAGFINLTIFETSIMKYELTNDIVRGAESSLKSASTFGDYYMLSPYVPSWNYALFIEAFGTAFLVFVIFAVTHPKNDAIASTTVPFVIGAALAVLIGTLGPLTGASLNPARDLGPRLITYFYGWGPVSLRGMVIYIVGPLIGGPIGAILADGILY
mmetsp:Transcript_733/g.857  ORF Transcript_733/g.857 Transcript_733/m.857 type:complete len:292 (+) Transcript_733:207-1082(+)